MDYDYEKKYLKYKKKYLELCKIKNNQKFKGGAPVIFTEDEIVILKQRLINIFTESRCSWDIITALNTDSDNSLTKKFFNIICNNIKYAKQCNQIKVFLNETNVKGEDEDEDNPFLGVNNETRLLSGAAALLKRKIELGSALVKEKFELGCAFLKGTFTKPKSTENNIIEDLIGDRLTRLLNIIIINMETEKLERS